MMDLMWLFTVPVLLMAIKTAVGLAALFLLVQVIRWGIQSTPPNPFLEDSREARKPYELDLKKRDLVLKQGFSKSKVPDSLDAIVIGSGIGGLTTAAILAKAGKKVLVLEQHDQAGGCCHTFVEKGYEFDVGIHYVGEMGSQTINKTLVDQITRGQLEWAKLEEEYDVVSIGYGQNNRKYPVTAGKEKWVELLKSQFPGEEAAIDKFLELIMSCRKSTYFHILLKLLPLWLVKAILWSGLLKVVTNFTSEVYTSTTLQIVEALTHNKDLQTVLMYCFGDYGTAPDKSPFIMQAILNRHFMRDGGHYPVGGASEIAFNIIPVIESTGGRVLVRANVSSILTRGRNNKISGVRVKKGTETCEILAPMVISSAGLYNTFHTLLPKEIAQKSYYTKLADSLKPGVGAMNVFLGLDASAEELGLKAQNHWAFTSSDITSSGNQYMAMAQKEVLDHPDIPLLFVSFPSAKDPNWLLRQERKGKSTCAIVTLASWEWFKQWEDKPVKKRGDEYDEIKKTLADRMIQQTCQLFPQITDHIDFTDIGTPVTNKFYIGQPYGEIYGLDHTSERFSPELVASLRPGTDLDGLYLTGQDVLTCGFTGALFAGLITAQVCLGRNVMADLVKLRSQIKNQEKSKTV